MPYRGLIPFAACALVACASGPHPALKVASSDLDCEQSAMKVHQIYPKKVRVEGCGQEAIYVDACDGYGVEAQCGWGRHYATQFERDAAERAKKERAEAKKQRAKEDEAERKRAEQEAADQQAIEQEKAEQEKLAKAQPAEADEEAADEPEAEAEAEAEKPEPKSTKRDKRGKKDEGIEAFLK